MKEKLMALPIKLEQNKPMLKSSEVVSSRSIWNDSRIIDTYKEVLKEPRDIKSYQLTTKFINTSIKWKVKLSLKMLRASEISWKTIEALIFMFPFECLNLSTVSTITNRSNFFEISFIFKA
jgi:hypothetical protein